MKKLKVVDEKNTKKHWTRNPIHEFVIRNETGYYCTEHKNIGPLNNGTMKQHVEGHFHGLNYETGEPMPKTKKETLEFPNPSDIITIEPTKNKPNNETLDLMTRLSYLFPTNEYARRVMASQIWFEGKDLADINNMLMYEMLLISSKPEPRKNYDPEFMKSLVKSLID